MFPRLRGLGDARLGRLAGLRLQGKALTHQCLERFAALGLRARKRAQPGQPDLARRFR